MAKIQFKSCALHNFIFPLQPVSLKRSRSRGRGKRQTFRQVGTLKAVCEAKLPKRQQEMPENREKCAGRGSRRKERGGEGKETYSWRLIL